MENITCKVCGETKKSNEFYRDKESKNGYRTKCKCCTKKGRKIREKTTRESYDIKLKESMGENYQIVSEYNFKKIEILHLKCGKTRFSTASNGLTRGCPYCKNNNSYISRIFHNFLTYNEVKYDMEYKISECKNILPLPFDFALFDGERLICLVEIDGEQHFKGNSRYNTDNIQKRDNIKNNYCKDNNLELIRIPYDTDNFISDFENILKKFSINVKDGFIIKDDYYSSEEATNIRKLYLEKKSMRFIENIIKKDYKYISRVIQYLEFPNQDFELKNEITEIYKSKTIKNKINFNSLSENEIENLKCFIKNGISSIKIAEYFNINRKNPDFLKLYNKLKPGFRSRTNNEILQFKNNELIEVYMNTQKIIEKNPNFNTNTIISCCTHCKKNYKGYKWFYRDKITKEIL